MVSLLSEESRGESSQIRASFNDAVVEAFPSAGLDVGQNSTCTYQYQTC